LIWNVPQCLYNHGNEIADRQNRSNVTRDFGKRLDDPVAAFANAVQFLSDPEFGAAPSCAPQPQIALPRDMASAPTASAVAADKVQPR
jgi:hypothetical protein